MAEGYANLAAGALRALPLAVVLTDAAGNVAARNCMAQRMLPAGPTLEQVLPTAGDTPLAWLSALQGQDGQASLRREGVRLQLPDGHVLLVDVSAAALPEAPGRFVLLVEDATARASMERRLAAGQRLAAMGRLAAEVAHELNNPLDGIRRYLGLAQRLLEAGSPQKVAPYLHKARDGLDRMGSIIADLLHAGRAAGGRDDSATAGELVRQALDAMAPSLESAGVNVLCDLDEPEECVVPGGLFQVCCNLLKNAADAMTGGGLLRIRVRRQEGQVTLSFADEGPGVAPDLLERIFEPFFSTKPGRGTGLGLSICRETLARWGGSIRAANRPEGGAEFLVTLPCRPARRGAAGQERA